MVVLFDVDVLHKANCCCIHVAVVCRMYLSREEG